MFSSFVTSLPHVDNVILLIFPKDNFAEGTIAWVF